jgi:hypothetical protein
MSSIVYQPRYIILRHLRQLLLEYAFQAGQNDSAVAFAVIVHNAEFDFTVAFFDHSRLHQPERSVNTHKDALANYEPSLERVQAWGEAGQRRPRIVNLGPALAFWRDLRCPELHRPCASLYLGQF